MNNRGTKQHSNADVNTSLEIIMAFTYYLMNSYVRLPHKKVGLAISEYLEKLANHPDCHSAILANAGRHLSDQWQSILEETEKAAQ